MWESQIFLYGGYYKDALAEKDGTEKGVVHADMWVLDPRTWEWNKVRIFETSIARLHCSFKTLFFIIYSIHCAFVFFEIATLLLI